MTLLSRPRQHTPLGRVLSRFWAERTGIAAVEFALLTPVLITLMFGTYELYFRLQAADMFHRYVVQVGDLLSRENQLATADIDRVFADAELMMPDIIIDQGLSLQVLSIGFDHEDDPVALWVRNNGPVSLPIDATRADGLGEFGQTLIQVTAQFNYVTPLQFVVRDGSITANRTAFYRPRSTRAIAIDGEIAEMNKDWDQRP